MQNMESACINSDFLTQKFLCGQKIDDVNRKYNRARLSNYMKYVGNNNYHGMIDHFGNSTFIVKLVSGSLHIQKCNLRPNLFPVAYFEL